MFVGGVLFADKSWESLVIMLPLISLLAMGMEGEGVPCMAWTPAVCSCRPTPVVLLLGPVVQGLGLGWVSAVLPLHRE